jgi:hypothetical protein
MHAALNPPPTAPPQPPTAPNRQPSPQIPVDDSTKVMLLAGSGLVAAVVLLIAGKGLSGLLSQRVSSNADRLVLIGGAFIATFVGARAILEL